MKLTDGERKILDGTRGEAMRTLLAEQVRVGEFFDAERFLPITNAHFMGDLEVLGEGGLAYLERLVEAELTVRVPTTRNAQSVDFEYAGLLGQSERLVNGERRVRALLGRLGVSAVNTCIGYQSIYQPRFGEHVGWGDTGTVAYANAVLGARTNYESGAAGIAAAITGRTPAYGYHLEHVRRGNIRVTVTASLPDVADWGALGALVGERCRGYWNVPVIELVCARPSPDQLKHLGASLASYGSIAMYHVVGVTPEAPTAEAAIGGRVVDDAFHVNEKEIAAVLDRDLARGGDIELVVFSGPQLSFLELKRVADALKGRRVADGVRLLLTTNAMTVRAMEEVGLLTHITDAGGVVLQGTCWYVMDPAAQRRQFGWTRLATNSAKLVNIIRAHGYEPALRRTDDCLEAALSGKLKPR